MSAPQAVIYGCSGPDLSRSEKTFFRDADPWGFILFARNVETPGQVKRLCGELREAVGREALIFIDQEGGRVRRLKEPHWDYYPPLSIYDRHLDGLREAQRAVWLHHRLMAHDLWQLGITADCAPVLDLPKPGSDPIISDRALSDGAARTIPLAHAAMAGLMSGGVAPVIKHIPGHGRADVDSHLELPRVTTERNELVDTDIAPFRALKDAPMAMSAHIVYDCVDKQNALSISRHAINQLVRGEAGFDGLLMSDDIGMKALSGTPTEIAEAVLAAGCDVVLHCDGVLPTMVSVAKGVRALDKQGQTRSLNAELCAYEPDDFDVDKGRAELAAILESCQDVSS